MRRAGRLGASAPVAPARLRWGVGPRGGDNAAAMAGGGMQQGERAAGSDAPVRNGDTADSGAAAGAARPSQRWSRNDRNTFLDHFAIDGDVARAAAAAGKTARSAYALRRRSTAFGAGWRLALDDAYERMEAALVRQVLGDTDTRMDVAAALVLLERRPGAAIDVATTPRKVATRNSPLAKAERELLRRVQAMARRSAAKAAE